MPCIQDENGNLKTEVSERLEVWRGYCERLMNVENDWDGEVDYAPVEGEGVRERSVGGIEEDEERKITWP